MFAAAIEACSGELELLARLATLSVVEPVLILDAAIHRISAERFGGHSILFTDSVVALKDQLGLVDKAVQVFNCLARHAKFAELDEAEVAERLEPRVSGQVLAWELVAQATTLALSGKREGYRAIFDRLAAVEPKRAPSTDSPGGPVALSSLTVHELAKAYVKNSSKHSRARSKQ